MIPHSGQILSLAWLWLITGSFAAIPSSLQDFTIGIYPSSASAPASDPQLQNLTARDGGSAYSLPSAGPDIVPVAASSLGPPVPIAGPVSGSTSPSAGAPIGIIAGGVVGAFCAIAAAVLALLCWRRRQLSGQKRDKAVALHDLKKGDPESKAGNKVAQDPPGDPHRGGGLSGAIGSQMAPPQLETPRSVASNLLRDADWHPLPHAHVLARAESPHCNTALMGMAGDTDRTLRDSRNTQGEQLLMQHNPYGVPAHSNRWAVPPPAPGEPRRSLDPSHGRLLEAADERDRRFAGAALEDPRRTSSQSFEGPAVYRWQTHEVPSPILEHPRRRSADSAAAYTGSSPETSLSGYTSDVFFQRPRPFEVPDAPKVYPTASGRLDGRDTTASRGSPSKSAGIHQSRSTSHPPAVPQDVPPLLRRPSSGESRLPTILSGGTDALLPNVEPFNVPRGRATGFSAVDDARARREAGLRSLHGESRSSSMDMDTPGAQPMGTGVGLQKSWMSPSLENQVERAAKNTAKHVPGLDDRSLRPDPLNRESMQDASIGRSTLDVQANPPLQVMSFAELDEPDQILSWSSKDDSSRAPSSVPLSFDSAHRSDGRPRQRAQSPSRGRFVNDDLNDMLEPKAGTKLSTYIVADMPDNVPMVVESHQSGRISVRRGSGSLDLPHSETPAVPIVNVAKWKYPAGADEGMNNAGIGRAGSVASSVTDLPVLPWSDWHIEPSDLQICTHPDGTQWKLGSGGYGSVYKALLDGVQEVAVKVFHDVHSIVEEADILREVAILKGCRDRNIVQFYGACRDPASGRILLVTEYMEAGDLYHALTKLSNKPMLSWYNRGQRIALEIARGLHHLHAKRIVHFDLKSANVLLTRDGTAKISDVGFANIISKTHLSYDAGYTFAWAAPEVLMGTGCTSKSDMYSFGVVLWELATSEQPRRGQIRPVNVPADCPKEIAALIDRCMDGDPGQRPSAKQAVEVLTAAARVAPRAEAKEGL